ncbi:MAG: anti-sigma factor domain-containing protein [Tissierellales bacterium]
MRGIVMEKSKDGLILMTGDGQFLEIKNYLKPAEIGQEIEVNNNSIHKATIYKRVTSIAAAIILFLTGGYGIFGYNTVYGYVDVDINPSVELSYNLYKRVIGVRGLNDDGETILVHVKDYKNKPIEIVVNKIIDSAVKENYINENRENAVLVTITENNNQVNDEKILEEIDSHIKDSSFEAEVLVIKSDKESYENAKKDSISPGRAKLIEKATVDNSQINPDDIKDKSIKEIMSIIKENKEEEKKEEKRIENEAKKLEKEKKELEKEKKELDKNNSKLRKEEKKKEEKANKEREKNEKEEEKANKEREKQEKKNKKNDEKENKKDEKVKDKENIKDKNDRENNNNKSNNRLKDKNEDKNQDKSNNDNSNKNKDKEPNNNAKNNR